MIKDKKVLPVGMSSFEKIIEGDYLYVDKTKFVADLVNNGTYYFLSRPRRFGKSLFVDTLKQAFLGNKSLFKGLYLENNWNWDIRYPVIHIDLGQGVVQAKVKLDAVLNATLDRHYTQYEIQNQYQDVSNRFRYLIDALCDKYKEQVVILIDEYDKPILDNITDRNNAAEMRDGLRDLYSVIKAVDVKLKFVFLTGITKFTKASLFSVLNNLEDISFKRVTADICGYTQVELENYFAEYLENVDKVKLKAWYNGYNFAGDDAQKVYNPFDILLFLNNDKQYHHYWFETGSPEFLIRLIEKNQYYFPDLERITIMEDSLSSFDVDNMALTTLLFQTGYLTIKEKIMLGMVSGYILSYPNLEVKASLNNQLAMIGSNLEHKSVNMSKLATCVVGSDINALAKIFNSYFSSIPHDWYRKNKIKNYEGFYASIIYSYFCALGYTTTAEEATNVGQIDLTVELPDKILILEFKLSHNGDAASALQQIKDNHYADKHMDSGKPLYLIGISFDVKTRNIHDFISEIMNNSATV